MFALIGTNRNKSFGEKGRRERLPFVYKVDEANGESGALTSGDDKNSPDSEPDAISWANRWATAFLMLPEER